MAIKPGTRFRSLYRADIEIVDYLGQGGQGFVYRILYNGEPKALKIYKPAALRDPKAFYENVKQNIEKGSPSDAFLWPLDILEWNGRTFGYVMNLCPPGYEKLGMYLAGRVKFSDFRAIANAALQIVAAFRILHNRGYSYQDLNDGNFFIDPRFGNVLICDNDNVAPNGRNTGILGKPRYMAPETVRGDCGPNTETDRFSLAVILFLMFTFTHPLEGRRFLTDCLTPGAESMLYGSEPLFILDRNDTRNAPVKGIHENIGLIWPELPCYLREAFERSFSQENLLRPGHRITEAGWQKLLIRFRSGIIHCEHCGEDILTYDPARTVCPACGKTLRPWRRLDLTGCDYEVPILPGTVVYRLQFGTANVEQAGRPILRVRVNPKDRTEMMLQNVSGTELECHTPSGKQKMVPDGAPIPVIPGITISAFGATAVIRGGA